MLQACSSTLQMIPHGPLMLLRSSYIDFTMARKSSFHHPSNQSPNEISARNEVLTSIGGSISCNSPHSTFWYRPRASQVDVSSIIPNMYPKIIRSRKILQNPRFPPFGQPRVEGQRRVLSHNVREALQS